MLYIVHVCLQHLEESAHLTVCVTVYHMQSIDFHENGKRHKENVVKSLKEVRAITHTI